MADLFPPLMGVTPYSSWLVVGFMVPDFFFAVMGVTAESSWLMVTFFYFDLAFIYLAPFFLDFP